MTADQVSITLDKVSKKFYRDWIFKNVSYQFQSGRSYAITGPNGSGKSTFLQVLAGFLPQTEGIISYQLNGKLVLAEDIYNYLSLAAPYMELIEEYTLKELIEFHTQFKPLKPGLSSSDLIALLRLEKSTHKQVHNFSSGMKQRVKLGLSLFSSSPILLLDEPTSNLDTTGAAWYKEHVTNIKDKLIIICSNLQQEYDFCDEVLNIVNYQ